MRYEVRVLRSDRKTLAIQVTGGSQVVVRAPKRLSDRAIDAFLQEHADWIALHLQKAAQREAEKQAVIPFTTDELRAFARQAAEELPPLCARYAEQMGVQYRRIAIRSQRTRWGSCSRQGNLNFNCLLALCPADVKEYVVVHELCHLKEMNHSPRFWREVRAVLPQYEQPYRWLKTEGQKLIERLPGPK
ncbi:MAG: M48 family metallopeptidase [Clostridia bacterium]|nr:M48 family metallopeptidase [Clostridia bacterium]